MRKYTDSYFATSIAQIVVIENSVAHWGPGEKKNVENVESVDKYEKPMKRNVELCRKIRENKGKNEVL